MRNVDEQNIDISGKSYFGSKIKMSTSRNIQNKSVETKKSGDSEYITVRMRVRERFTLSQTLVFDISLFRYLYRFCFRHCYFRHFYLSTKVGLIVDVGLDLEFDASCFFLSRLYKFSPFSNNRHLYVHHFISSISCFYHVDHSFY
jgi:hypothetical protein